MTWRLALTVQFHRRGRPDWEEFAPPHSHRRIFPIDAGRRSEYDEVFPAKAEFRSPGDAAPERGARNVLEY